MIKSMVIPMKQYIKIISIPVLAALLIFVFLFYQRWEEVLYLTVYETDTGLEISGRLFSENTENIISAFQADSDSYFLFLPSYAEDKQLKIDYDAPLKPLDQHLNQSQITSGISYMIDNQYRLTLLTASDIPTVYFDLKHDLSYIEADKSLTDSGQATLLNVDGSTAYLGELKEISGRGNTSWEQDKKPFNFKLGDAVSLFGMNPSKSYSLISSTDLSFLRNHISNEMGEVMGALTLKRTFVNLYINDSYQGIYELCERVSTDNLGLHDLEQETASLNLQQGTLNQLTTNETMGDWNDTITGKWWDYNNDPENITGGYLLEADQALRYADEPSGFTLDSGTYMVSKSPAYLSQAQHQYISGYIQSCENAMLESVNADTYHTLTDYIDVPSFVAKYLVEEVSKNIDCSATSQFFYKNKDGLLFAGPPWDFDWAYGVSRTYDEIDFSNPEGFSARDIPGTLTWWQLLYYNNAFYQDIVTTYENVLYPWLDRLTETTIWKWEKQLSQSAVMDYIRWNYADTWDLNSVKQAYHKQVAAVADFLNTRKEFLYKEWIAAPQE